MTELLKWVLAFLASAWLSHAVARQNKDLQSVRFVNRCLSLVPCRLVRFRVVVWVLCLLQAYCFRIWVYRASSNFGSKSSRTNYCSDFARVRIHKPCTISEFLKPFCLAATFCMRLNSFSASLINTFCEFFANCGKTVPPRSLCWSKSE